MQTFIAAWPAAITYCMPQHFLAQFQDNKSVACSEKELVHGLMRILEWRRRRRGRRCRRAMFMYIAGVKYRLFHEARPFRGRRRLDGRSDAAIFNHAAKSHHHAAAAAAEQQQQQHRKTLRSKFISADKAAAP
jgi:hypothetical protein